MVNIGSSMRGEFKLVARGPGGTRETPWFENLITDLGLNRLGNVANSWGNGANYQDCATRCEIGTGNATPAYTDTQLQAYYAGVTRSNTADLRLGSPTFGQRRTCTFAFPQGAVVGNMAEVGVGWAASNLFSRTLIVDGGGAPTTFTVAAIDQLTVYYRLYIYPELGMGSHSMSVAGSGTHDVTLKLLFPTTGWGTFYTPGLSMGPHWYSAWGYSLGGTVTLGADYETWPAATNGSGGLGGNVVETTYVPDSFQKTFTYSWSISEVNHTNGLGGLIIWTRTGAWQCKFDPPIPKDNTKTLSLVVTFSWGRYTP